jgi:hypothetical protein
MPGSWPRPLAPSRAGSRVRGVAGFPPGRRTGPGSVNPRWWVPEGQVARPGQVVADLHDGPVESRAIAAEGKEAPDRTGPFRVGAMPRLVAGQCRTVQNRLTARNPSR